MKLNTDDIIMMNYIIWLKSIYLYYGVNEFNYGDCISKFNKAYEKMDDERSNGRLQEFGYIDGEWESTKLTEKTIKLLDDHLNIE